MKILVSGIDAYHSPYPTIASPSCPDTLFVLVNTACMNRSYCSLSGEVLVLTLPPAFFFTEKLPCESLVKYAVRSSYQELKSSIETVYSTTHVLERSINCIYMYFFRFGLKKSPKQYIIYFFLKLLDILSVLILDNSQ